MENMGFKLCSGSGVRWIGDWDKPDQAPSFGLTIRSKDRHPCFHIRARLRRLSGFGESLLQMRRARDALK
jgi:hypothetical protein